MSPAARPSSKTSKRTAKALRVVVTAGPTREYVDPVRFLSNESSGKMGFAIAAAAAKAGHHVTLIAGPVNQPTPQGVERVDVVSAREMLAALKESFADADALFMAAAVADFRPRRRLSGKWKKKEDGADDAVLELVKNPDLLATVARRKGKRKVIGFALETSNGVRRALEKLRRKNADYIVLNDASALSAGRSSVQVFGAEGEVARVEDRPKAEVAAVLVSLLDRD
ncbi:MAG: phosphopantothenoylcysteine decarboxylase [Planctomycetota bacterium]|nr:phosphopantothenoylcysteine decarboxylase [Planctomycetota bacterium]